jgi:hypothetical protein
MSDVLSSAMEKVSEAIRESEAKGYRTGFIAGWLNAIQHIESSIHRLEASDIDEVIAAHITRIDNYNKSHAPQPSVGRPPREGSDQDSVLRVIRNEPGLRGADIVSRLTGKVHERTVRTSLHRLKTRGLIEPRDSKWWPKSPEQGETEFQAIEGQSAATD